MEDIDQITEVLQSSNVILAAFLFGSVNTDRFHDNSDIDIAILPFPGKTIDGDEFLCIQGKLLNLTNRIVDLGVLTNKDVIYAHQVIATGKLLFTRNQYETDLFIATSLGQYAMLKEERKVVEEAYTYHG